MRTEASRTEAESSKPPVEPQPGENQPEPTSNSADEDALQAAALDSGSPRSADDLQSLSPAPARPVPTLTGAEGSIQRTMQRVLQSLSLDERLGRIILSLVLAVLLWFYVTNLENPAQVTQFNGLSLEVRGLDSSLKIINTLPAVNVTVQAPQNMMSTLRQTDVHPYVDLQGLDAGVHEVPVALDLSDLPDRNAMTFSVTPQNVQVQLELQASRVFSVAVQVTGTPAFYYGVEPAQVNPQQVTISGPESAINRIAQVTVAVDVSGSNSTQSGFKSPVALDSAGKVITGLHMEPSTVQVVVPIKLLVVTKAVPVHVPVVGNPAPGYSASEINVDPKTVTICCAPSDVLEKIGSIDTNPVSISNTTSTVVTTTQLILPTGVQLYPGQSSTISVTVQISTFETSWQLSVVPSVENVARGLTAIPSPSSLTVTLSGTLAQFQSLSPTDIVAAVDARGLSAGTYQLDPQVRVPQGITVQSVDPPKVALSLIAPTPVPPTPTQTLVLTATPRSVAVGSPTPPTPTPTLVPVPTAMPTEAPTSRPVETPSPAASPALTQSPAPQATSTPGTGAEAVATSPLPGASPAARDALPTPTP